MDNCSYYIKTAMEYIDDRIMEINPDSIDRLRLQSSIRRIIVANIFRLRTENPVLFRNRVHDIYNEQLLIEISRSMRDK